MSHSLISKLLSDKFEIIVNPRFSIQKTIAMISSERKIQNTLKQRAPSVCALKNHPRSDNLQIDTEAERK